MSGRPRTSRTTTLSSGSGASGGPLHHERLPFTRDRERLLPRVGEEERARGLVQYPLDRQAPARGPVEDMKVEPRDPSLERLLRAAAPRQGAQRAGLRSVDRLAVRLHPPADRLQPLDALRRDLPVGRRADVQEEVPALRGDLRELADQLPRRLEALVGAVVAPVVVHRHAGFPVEAGNPRAGDLLLGRAEVADEVALGVEAEIAPGAADAVVDDDLRLERADVRVHVAPARVGPVPLPLAVEPHHADRAVVREELAELRLHVADVPLVVGAGRRAGLPVAAGKVVRVMPVHDRVVPADPQALLPAGVRERLHDVPAERGGHDVEVGLGRVEEAEPVVVLGGDHDVLHAGLLRQADPGERIEFPRVEPFAEGVVLVDRDPRGIPDPLSVAGLAVPLSGGNGVEPPVDEHAEAGLPPPVEARVGAGRGAGSGGGRRGCLRRLALSARRERERGLRRGVGRGGCGRGSRR